ncbi:MAG: hypothetical protein IJN94_08700 [Clostridia bacterium]|nr:hypothetical protein [Clostridia bacterium]
MKKFNDVLGKIYGIMMTASFFGGIVPLIPFIIALFVGGDFGETVSLFIYNKFYPWVIAIGSLAVLVGLVHTYIGDFLEKKANKQKEIK